MVLRRLLSRLGEGASLSEALTQAKTEAIAAGRPAAAWASLVLLGDGDVRPFPEGRHPTPRTVSLVGALSIGIVLAFAFAVYKAMRRGRATPAA